MELLIMIILSCNYYHVIIIVTNIKHFFLIIALQKDSSFATAIVTLYLRLYFAKRHDKNEINLQLFDFKNIFYYK